MPHSQHFITVIEDDPIMGEALAQTLSLEGYRVDWCETVAQGHRALSKNLPDLVVCDIRLPDGGGDDLFRSVAARGPAPPFLFMTAYGDIDQAVGLMRAGAADYVTKPFETREFLDRVSLMLARRPRADPDATLGVSSAIRHVEDLVRRVAAVPSSVLILGETGAGKEVCARVLHRCSGAADKPFVAVNCAAIPTELLESEIFGHERGAFTGATKRHIGFAERARDGILFLDEIGELAPALQTKLLRVLEHRTFQRVGGEQQLELKARVVCATNADLARRVADGRFREDLFYRINVVAITVPPLRSRVDDIPWLMDRFFSEFVVRIETRAKGFSSLSYGAAMDHSWPGNVRELRNRVERAVVLAFGDWIMPADLFPERHQVTMSSMASILATLSEVRDDAEKRQIARALAANLQNFQETADALGVSRSTLFAKMRKLGVRE